MKLIIFGASGKTGAEIVKLALIQGHKVTAFVRDPSSMVLKNNNLDYYTGDVFDLASVERAIKGHDAVICALGVGNDLKKTTVRTNGTINIIKSMKKGKVKRLIVMSAMGVGNSWDSLSRLNKLFFATLLKNSRDDHEAQETAVFQSELYWTIIRPSGLTDTPLTGDYKVGVNISAETSRIARADVADLILKELEQKALIGKAVPITN